MAFKFILFQLNKNVLILLSFFFLDLNLSWFEKSVDLLIFFNHIRGLVFFFLVHGVVVDYFRYN